MEPRDAKVKVPSTGNVSLFQDAVARGNWKVMASFLGPAFRGFVQQRGKSGAATLMKLGYQANFDWNYDRNFPEMAKLYEAAKKGQWNATTDLDWKINVDPRDSANPIVPDSFIPSSRLPLWGKLSDRERGEHRHAFLSWLLSQFLHGEQGALFAAAQVTEATPWLDAKLYGSTQVVDEGRHVEVFHAYLSKKLEKIYQIDDNLYVVIDALMTDSRWDIKFLGMQIMVEGLALGAFATIRQLANDPLLKQLLSYVIGDEARHVHYGVLALEDYCKNQLSAADRRYREGWAFEVAVLLRNRFLLREFYDEYYGHALSRKAWDQLVFESELMGFFRQTMFKRMIPNLKRIGLLSDRIRPHYESLGLLVYEGGKAAPDLTSRDLLEDT